MLVNWTGSGTGMLAEWLSQQGFDLFCIDPSIEMVRRCRQRDLHVLQSSLQEFQPTEQYGMIMAILSLIHIPKSQFANEIKKLAAALHDGGLLFLGMLEGNTEGVFEGPDFPRFFAYYNAKEILSLVKPYLQPLDLRYHRSGTTGYMLFLFQKRQLS